MHIGKKIKKNSHLLRVISYTEVRGNAMKYIATIIAAIVFTAVQAQAITGEEALARFKGRMLGLGKLSGVVSWSSDSGGQTSGTFKYMAPDKIYVKFTSPAGKVLVCNGKRLWVYNPASNICGIQDLARGSSSGGIASMFDGYKAIASGGGGGYTIKLKNPDRQYSEVTLKVDGTFFLSKAILKNKDGGIFTISLSNVNKSASVGPAMFHFSVPTNATTVTNPLDVK